MPIYTSEVPQAAFDAISQAVTASRNKFAARKSDRPAGELGALSLSVPHRVAYLPLGKIDRDNRLREATQLGNWRYLVLREREAPAVAPVGDHAGATKYVSIAAVTALPVEGDKYEFGMWNNGPFATGTETTIRTAEKLEQVRNGDYEPLLLVAPAVYVTALWLRDRRNNDNEDSDLILTIPPSNPVLTSYEPIRPKEFLDKLHDSAAKVPPDSETV